MTARQINTQDYDDLCSILRWCGGRALGEGYEPAVMEVPGRGVTQHAKHGDWIKVATDGTFWVTSDPDGVRCSECLGARHDLKVYDEPCPGCQGSGRNPWYTERDLRAEAARYAGDDWSPLEITAAMADRNPWARLSDQDFQDAFGEIVARVEQAANSPAKRTL